ncbi:hypothetical protein K7432_016040, partial [Basidiobolus ranarum]
MPLEHENREKEKEKEDRPSKLPWGVTPETLQPGTIKQITKDKLQAFSVGNYKKTAFQRHREELELKKKKETEDAAKVYAEFVASFEEEPDVPKTFVKGGTLAPKDSYNQSSQNETTSNDALLKPQMFVSANQTSAPKPIPRSTAFTSPEIQYNRAPSREEYPNDSTPRREEKGKKKRNLDSFLEEIKKEQEQPEERLRQKRHVSSSSVVPTKRVHPEEPGASSIAVEAAFEEKSGSHDTGDPDTTNLYIGNISPQANEDTLCKEFGRFGPIACVKIM